MKTLLLICLFGALELCSGAKILAIVPIPSRSHHNILERIAIELTKKGHEVTLVTPYKQPKPVPRLNEIILPDMYQKMINMMTQSDENSNKTSNFIQMGHRTKWIWPFLIPMMGSSFSEMVLSSPQVIGLIEKNEKYDVILGEMFFVEAAIAGFSYKSKASIIGIAGFMPNIWANHLVGNPAPAAYVPDSLVGHASRMNFWERLENTVYTGLSEISYRLFYLRGQDSVMRKYFGDGLPPLEDIIKNTSLVLVNHHFALAFPRPYLPNMVEIGGYHINPPKPLPAELQKYFDESKHGVILFSMGSHIKSTDLPQEKKQEILKAFSRLKEDVLWKFEDDTLTDLPKNVKISKWVPQSDILAHPNLKLFITHGGLLSTTEAVVRGVPVIGIPIAGDQPVNMKYTTMAGYGLTLELKDISESMLYDSIVEVLNNPKYRKNVKGGSFIINDRPLPPIDTALYWIEYVIRHKGAPHLRSAAQDLNWYQLYLLDVLGFILISSFLLIYILFKVVKFILGKLFCIKTSHVSKRKKKN